MNTYSVTLYNTVSYPVNSLIGFDKNRMGLYRVLEPFESYGPIMVEETTYKFLKECQPNIKVT